MNARQKRTARRLALRCFASVRGEEYGTDTFYAGVEPFWQKHRINRSALLDRWIRWRTYRVIVERIALKRPNSDTDEVLTTGAFPTLAWTHGRSNCMDAELRVAIVVDAKTQVLVAIRVLDAPCPLNVTVVKQIDTFVPDVARLTQYLRETHRCTDGPWNFTSIIEVPAKLTALYVDALPAEPLTIGRWLDDTRPYATVRQ